MAKKNDDTEYDECGSCKAGDHTGWQQLQVNRSKTRY